MPGESLLFTRQAVLDAMCVAPAPLTRAWVKLSLATVSSLVRWIHATGQPLTREHVFDEETRLRYLQQTNLKPASTRTYEIRLDLIAGTLTGITQSFLPDASSSAGSVTVVPLSETEEADLWAWSRGLRPHTRRHRMQVSLVLGLGVGLSRNEKYEVRGRDIRIDADGVHVTNLPSRTGQPREVTCLREWETRLADLTKTVPDGNYLIAPDRSAHGTHHVIDRALWLSMGSAPVQFNNTRLRNTWFARHIMAGTLLPVLKDAAGIVDMDHVMSVMRLLPPVEADVSRSWLRGRDDG